MEDPGASPQGLRKGKRYAAGCRLLFERIYWGFGQAKCDRECQESRDQIQKQRPAHGGFLFQVEGDAHRLEEVRHEVWIVNRCPHAHGDDESYGLSAMYDFKNLWPGVVDSGLL